MKLLLILVTVAVSIVCHAYLPTSTPESQGVSSAGIRAWIDACEKELGGIHSFVFLRHGKLIAEGYWKPYAQNETHMLYSHSKSFTSTAIGFLVEEGKLDLDEKVADIFPDKLPAKPSKNLLEMRVRDLLTMGTGSVKDSIFPVVTSKDGDWVRAFLAHPVEKSPGTHFCYNTGATYMLSAIVEKKTGEKLMDYLGRKLFKPLGITSAWSTTCPKGIACGGYGMNMVTRELALFGQLYLQKGMWEGKRILSDQWTTLATTKQIGNGNDPNSDWKQGYGFQFWRCRHGAYRADGARGQYTIVMPELDAVLSITASVNDMGKELNLVWKYILPAIQKAKLPENKAEHDALVKRCAELSLPLVKGDKEGLSMVLDKDYTYEPNKHGVKSMKLLQKKDGWEIVYTTQSGTQRFPIGYGEWKFGNVKFEDEKYETLGGIIDQQKIASSGAWTAPDTFTCKTYLVGGPSEIDFVLKFTAATLTAEVRKTAFRSAKFTLTGSQK